MTSDGKPYAPKRYNEIIEENYWITKFTHTSYSDILKMSVLERNTLINLIHRDLEKEHQARQRLLNKQ